MYMYVCMLMPKDRLFRVRNSIPFRIVGLYSDWLGHWTCICEHSNKEGDIERTYALIRLHLT